MLILSSIDHSVHIQGGCLGPGLQVLLDTGELLHPGHPGGDVGVLTDHPGLHQPHQVHDGVEGEVGVGGSVPTEILLSAEHLNKSR